MSKQVPVDAPWTAKKAAQWDAITVDQWIKRNTLIPRVRDVLLAYLQPAFGTDGKNMSLLFLLWFIATAGDETHPGTFARSSGTADGAQDSRYVGGSGLIPLRMADALADRVALNAPVRRIAQTDSAVEVSTDRGTVQAKRVIVAVPPPLALGIEWSPALPSRRRQLLEHMPMGRLMKCAAVYETPFWRDKGLSGSGVATYGAVRAMFDNSPEDAAVGVLLGFVGGSAWETYGRLPLAERRGGRAQGLRPVRRQRGTRPDRVRRARLDAGRVDDGQPHRVAGTGRDHGVRLDHPRAGRPRALGRHRDRHVLVRVHGRRRPRRRACRGRGRSALL